jgi:hypothetical protein
MFKEKVFGPMKDFAVNLMVLNEELRGVSK